MRSAFLFDLDGTLIDTSRIEQLRRGRKWKDCVRRLSETSVYPGIGEVLAKVREAKGKIAVVTTSVSFYAENALRFHKLPYDCLVAYHDVPRRKPAPDAYLKAIHLLGASKGAAIGIGDDAVDADALTAAEIMSVAAAWNSNYHAHAQWDLVAKLPSDVLKIR